MGEVYRGLTIKIGGDTTSLQKALKSTTYDAKALGQQLKAVNSAARMDPTSAQAAALKVKVLGEQLTNSYVQLKLNKAALSQLGKDRNIDALRAKFQSMGVTVGSATDRYNNLNNAIATSKNTIDKLQAKAKELKSLDTMTDSQQRQLEEVNARIAEETRRLTELRSGWQGVSEQLHEVQAVTDFDVQTAKIAKMEAQVKKLGDQYVAAATAKSALVDTKAFGDAAVSITRATTAAEGLDDRIKRVNAALEQMPNDGILKQMKFELLSEKLGQAEDKAKALKTQLDEIARQPGMKNVAEETKDVTARVQQANEKLAATRNEVSRVEAELREYVKQKQAMDDGVVPKEAERYEKLQASINECRTSLTALRESESAAATEANQANLASNYRDTQIALKETQGQIAGINSEMEGNVKKQRSFASNLTNLGLSLSTTLTPAISMAARGAVEGANDIDSAFRDMKKTVNGTDEDFARLRQSAIKFSTTHVTSADQMLEIQALGGQLGIAAGDLDAFATTISNIATATNLSTDEAATDLGQLANIMHLTSADYDSFANALVRLGNNNATQESNIMEITTRIGSMGTIVGMTAPQILAWADAVASTGQKSESAGTAISNTMSDIETAVSTGGESLEKFASIAGESSEDFAKQWDSNASGAMKAFIDGLTEIDESGGSVDTTLQELGITGVRQKQALEGLVQENKTLSDGTNVLNDALAMSQDAWDGISDKWGDAGDAANEASQKSEGFSGTLQIMKNNAEVLGSELADSFTPTLKGVADFLGNVSELASGMGGNMKRLISSAAIVAAAAGPAMTMMGATIPALQKFKDYLGGVDTLFLRHTKTLKAFAATSKTAALASNLLVGGLTAAAAILATVVIAKVADYAEEQKKLRKRIGLAADAQKSMNDLMDGSSISADKAQKALEGTAKSADSMKQAVDNASDGIDQFHQGVVDKMGDASSSISMLERYRDTISDLNGHAKKGTQGWIDLTEAVKGLNDMCGTNYSVDEETGRIKDSTGAVLDNIDAINDLIAAKERQIKIDAYSDVLKDAYKGQAEAARTLKDARDTYNQVSQKVAEAGPNVSPKLAQEYKDASDALGKAEANMGYYDDAVNDASADLSELQRQQATANQTVDDFTAALEDADMGADEFQQAADHIGVSTDDLAKKLSDAGISTTEFASLGAENFDALYDATHGDMGKMQTAIQMVDDMKIDPKSIHVTDDGTITSSAEGLEGLRQITINGKHYYVTDDGSIYTQSGKLAQFGMLQVDGKHYYVSDDGTIYDQSGQVAELNMQQIDGKYYYVGDDGSVYDSEGVLQDFNAVEVDGKYYKVDDDGSITENGVKIGQLQGTIDNLHGTTVTMKADTSQAEEKLSGLKGILQALTKPFQMQVSAETYGNFATGGLFPGRTIKAVPHADGGISGYVTSPTLTNVGIVGEAGTEAVLGNAIIPLSNSRYVRPFAHAVATELAPDLEKPFANALTSVLGHGFSGTLDMQERMVNASERMEGMLAASAYTAQAVSEHGEREQAATSQSSTEQSVTNNYSVYIDGARINDDEGVRSVVVGLFEQLLNYRTLQSGQGA